MSHSFIGLHHLLTEKKKQTDERFNLLSINFNFDSIQQCNYVQLTSSYGCNMNIYESNYSMTMAIFFVEMSYLLKCDREHNPPSKETRVQCIFTFNTIHALNCVLNRIKSRHMIKNRTKLLKKTTFNVEHYTRLAVESVIRVLCYVGWANELFTHVTPN